VGFDPGRFGRNLPSFRWKTVSLSRVQFQTVQEKWFAVTGKEQADKKCRLRGLNILRKNVLNNAVQEERMRVFTSHGLPTGDRVCVASIGTPTH
jgi:hypothetical protein